AAVLGQLKRAQRIMAYVQHVQIDAFRGRVLGIGGPRCEERLPEGTPAGAVTGLIYETMPRGLRAKYVVPAPVFAIEDYELKYALLARLAVRAGDVSAIATANPSTILRLLEVTRDSLRAILAEMEHGEAPLLGPLSPELRRALRPLAAPDRARAAALRPLLERRPGVTMAELWPELRAVVTWLGGGCAHAAEAVRLQLPPGARMIDAGYVASEMRGTVVVDAERGLAVPLLEDVFLEFVPVEAWNRGDRNTLLLHQLEEGCDYHVIVSTQAGLLRYHMNDVLRAGPQIGRTPSLAFLRKGRGATNITGEKLTEDQVHLATAQAARAAGASARFHIFVALPALSRYRAHVEFDGAPPDPGRFAQLLDQALSTLNIEYAAKRGSGRLLPIELALLRPGAGEAYRRHCIEKKGQRESQLKVLALQTAEECDFAFEPFRHADAPVAVPVR
ncbi:MAG TPA: GH3 auxin-responsive promoter family protein, partial [Alphaproteobacteria bacterium]